MQAAEYLEVSVPLAGAAQLSQMQDRQKINEPQTGRLRQGEAATQNY